MKVDYDWQIHELRKAADIQEDRGDLVLSGLLYQASVTIRKLASTLQEIKNIVGDEDE